MRGILSWLTLVLILVAGVSCSHKTTKWSKYNGDRTFTVLLPGAPVVTDKVEATPFGKQNVHYVTWKPATLELYKFKLFQVAYTDCPARFTSDTGLMHATLDSSINQRKKDFTDNEIRSQPIELNGYPGRAFIFDPSGENVVTIVKQIIANNKRYELTVVAKRDYPTNDEIGNFFNSFTILR